jgi:integrase
MARRVRSSTLETRSARLKLPVSKQAIWITIGHGLGIGYRRNQGPGSWSGRQADGKGGYQTFVVATADDYDTANGGTVMDYWQCLDAIRAIGLGKADDDGTKLQSVADAVAAYRADLKARGGEEANAQRLLPHLPTALSSKIVASLNSRELRHFRDGLLEKGLKPGSVSRYCKSLAAALSLAAAHDPRVKNRDSWRIGLAALPDSSESRNVILSDTEVRHVVRTAYEVSQSLGLFVELAAVTGARPSQLKRLVVADVQKARLMMPSSKKGKGRKRIEHRPVPIPEALALRLRGVSKGKSADAPLLVTDDGAPWPKNHRTEAREVVTRAGLDPDEVTIYALRHSSIVRQLLKGIPVRIVADAHDTSVAMIEKTYSKYISHHADDLLRGALLDVGEPPAANVVPLGERS